MRQPLKQAALPVGLAFSCILSIVFLPAFSATTAAQAGARMLGPQFPILMDNGDGVPGPGDTQLLPRLSGATTLQLPTTFSCGTQNNTAVTLGSTDGSGRFRSASRANNGRTQVVNVTGTSGPSAATQFSYSETAGTTVRGSGNGSLVDSNGDGAADAMSISGSKGSAIVSFVFTPNSTYVSIPPGQAALLGARQGRCGPAVGQVWVPLADTNGDGRGDAIVLDLDGNGIADPQFFSSPPIGAQGVPTTNTFGLALLIALLGGCGVWYLRQRPITDAGTV